jgi:hypothetical protein
MAVPAAGRCPCGGWPFGGPPEDNPKRYRDTSPIALLTVGCRQVIVHGTADDAVPFDLSVRYTAAAALGTTAA